MSMYTIIQEGHCIWGRGETIESCIRDANQWLGHYSIRKFEPHDHNGSKQGGLTDWTVGRRYQISGGDMFITDDPSIIDGYELKNTFPPKSGAEA